MAGNILTNTQQSFGILNYRSYCELLDYTNYPQLTSYYTGDDGLSAQTFTNQSALLVVIAGSVPVSGAGGIGSVGVANSTAWGAVSAATVATVGTFTAFPAQAARTLNVMNNSGATIYAGRAGVPGAVPIVNNTSLLITLVSTTSEVALSASAVANIYGLWTAYV